VECPLGLLLPAQYCCWPVAQKTIWSRSRSQRSQHTARSFSLSILQCQACLRRCRQGSWWEISDGDAISERGRGHVLAFWEYAAFLANSIVFIAIGSEEAHQSFGLFSYESSIAIILVLIGRAFAVYPLCAVFLPTRLRLDMRYQHVLVWGGLRGALGLALALSLPENLAERQQIVVTAFAVVAFSIFAQGLSMPWLIRRLGLRSGPKKPRPEFRSD
jgi:sodium/hydrogen exchanger family protein